MTKKDDDFKKKRAAKGGDARAMKLTPTERRKVASKAARKRWGLKEQEVLPKAICGSDDKPLKIGDIEIPCYVLEDGRRVLAQRGLQTALGMSTGGGKGGARKIGEFLARFEGSGIDLKGLGVRANSPFWFDTNQPHNRNRALGYEATVLADLCEVVMAARDAGLLTTQWQQSVARQCELLMRGFARVGIIALVDEITGYQEMRARTALANILERWIAKELRRYQSTFPLEFYEHMYRLRKWHFDPESVARPGAVANYTVDLTYSRMAPELLERLKEKAERRESGRLKHHMHRWLTEDAGHPALKEHIAAVVALMKISDSWDQFMRNVDRVFPKFKHTIPLALPEPTED